ncbi:GNAT family N-acetyltransferase [bacterium]|nr:GNAT family N-acetyltransferase [bacterium]
MTRADISIVDAKLCDLESCAAIACDSEIGRRYHFDMETLAGSMRRALESGAIIVAAREALGPGSAVGSGSGAILGFAWIDPRGAFGSAPYLKLIAVDGKERSGGVGAALLAEFERRAPPKARMLALLVSDFNDKAIVFYERHGFAKAGALPDFAVDGVTEILMVKRRAP